MFQYQSQSIRPLTTAHLAQTMTLLGMNLAELSQKIEAELASNPALEMLEERHCPTCRRRLADPGPCPVCSRPKSADPEEPIVFVSSQYERFDAAGSQMEYGTDDLPDDNIAPSEDLPTFVLRQVASELAVEDRAIAAHVLTSLDDDGLLASPVIEIARYHHVPAARVQEVIAIIQRADPIGVGSATTQEALLVQLQVLEENKKAVHPLAERAIREGMDHLLRQQYKEIASLLGITIHEAEEISRFIGANLNPYPARAYWGDIHQGINAPIPVYHQPDILIKPLNGDPGSTLVVEILMPIRGTLQINKMFQETFKETAGERACEERASEERVARWKKDLENASLLIKCIQQRNNTMQRMMAYLASHQREYILRGDQFLKPITRASIAEELGVHESTISRAVARKCLQLPNGHIIPLNQFFDRSLHIRAHLKEIIKNERGILTDSQLASRLAKRGYKIARRTVAKYRAMEGILPAHLRKNMAGIHSHEGACSPGT